MSQTPEPVVGARRDAGVQVLAEERRSNSDRDVTLDDFEALLEAAERITKSASSRDRNANGGAAANG
jgi:hypothetical protein